MDVDENGAAVVEQAEDTTDDKRAITSEMQKNKGKYTQVIQQLVYLKHDFNYVHVNNKALVSAKRSQKHHSPQNFHSLFVYPPLTMVLLFLVLQG